MAQENKELLLIDLCARLPYKIIVKVNDTQGIMDEIDIPNERIFVSNLNPFLYGGARASWFTVNGDKIYPYLRPMSSMTEDEFNKLKEYSGLVYDQLDLASFQDGAYKCLDFYLNEVPADVVILVFDWLNAHHFDYRGLIEKGLALETPEGMYN